MTTERVRACVCAGTGKKRVRACAFACACVCVRVRLSLGLALLALSLFLFFSFFLHSCAQLSRASRRLGARRPATPSVQIRLRVDHARHSAEAATIPHRSKELGSRSRLRCAGRAWRPGQGRRRGCRAGSACRAGRAWRAGLARGNPAEAATTGSTARRRETGRAWRRGARCCGIGAGDDHEPLSCIYHVYRHKLRCSS